MHEYSYLGGKLQFSLKALHYPEQKGQCNHKFII